MASRKKTEELIGDVWGINAKNEVTYVSVYRKGASVRMVGPIHHSHLVHPSNAGSVDGFKAEAVIVFHMTDVIYMPQGMSSMGMAHPQIEALKEKALSKREAAARAMKTDNDGA